MKAIDALRIVNTEGLDNSQWDVIPDWRYRCEGVDMDSVELAEAMFSSFRYSACAISIHERRPVESVLFAWREDKDEATVFRGLEEPLVIVMTCDGAVVEVYKLE